VRYLRGLQKPRRTNILTKLPEQKSTQELPGRIVQIAVTESPKKIGPKGWA